MPANPNAPRAAEMPIEQIEDHLRHAYLCHHGRWASWDREAMRSSLREVLQEVLQEAAGGVAFWREMAFQQGNEIASITAALDEARREAVAPMGFGTSKDAYYNLEGAIIDLEHQKADKICIKTLKRVQSQIAALLDTPSPADQPVTPADGRGE